MPDILNIGVSGLHSSKKSLETTSHNIANVNTEGYSKQKVHQGSNSPLVKGGLIFGSGARIYSVSREHDPYIEKRLNSNISDTQYFKARTEQLEQLENLFNEIDQDGLNKIVNNFFNSFKELSNSPENQMIRSVVRDNANLLVNDFRRISKTLTELKHSINSKLKMEVSEINEITRRLSDLNKKIHSLEIVNNETGDLRDKRDLLIQELSKSFKIHTYQDDTGRYIVNAVNVGTLVTGTNAQELVAGALSHKKGQSNEGIVQIFFKGRPAKSITHKFRGGRISSLENIRSNDIQAMQDSIDLVAHDLTQTVNSVHKRGFVNRKLHLNQRNNPVERDHQGPTTGIKFFNDLTGVRGASEKISLSKDVKSDLSNIVTAVEANSPGDNRIALAISKIQGEKVIAGGAATLEETYLSSIGNLGVQAKKANLDQEQAEGLFALTNNIKERSVGVSLDEEAANMVKYQQAYEANAKVMQTADEMIKTLMAIKN